MQNKLLSFGLYFCILIPLIFYIGMACYHNGKVYVLAIFKGNKALSASTNNLLLLCYYLLNIGYVLYSVVGWEAQNSFTKILGYVFFKISIIILLLGIIHYINIFSIMLYAFYTNFLTSKNKKQTL